MRVLVGISHLQVFGKVYLKLVISSKSCVGLTGRWEKDRKATNRIHEMDHDPRLLSQQWGGEDSRTGQTGRSIRKCTWFLREAVGDLSWGTFKTRLDMALSNLVQLKMFLPTAG